MVADIRQICQGVFDALGKGHSEAVYQKALVIELYNAGALSVEYEKAVPVFFVDSNNVQHTVGSERVDILARMPNQCVVLLELKALQKLDPSCCIQLHKYIRSLQCLGVIVSQSHVVNFPQKNLTDSIELLSDFDVKN